MIKNRLADLVRKRMGHRIMATIIASITVVMGVEIVLDLYFGKKDTLQLMETLSMDLAASTYSGIKYPMSVGDSAAVEQVLTDIREKMETLRSSSATPISSSPGQPTRIRSTQTLLIQ
jgi:hypothetical protein